MHFWSSECFLLPPRLDFLLDVTFADCSKRCWRHRSAPSFWREHFDLHSHRLTHAHTHTHACIGSELNSVICLQMTLVTSTCAAATHSNSWLVAAEQVAVWLLSVQGELRWFTAAQLDPFYIRTTNLPGISQKYACVCERETACKQLDTAVAADVLVNICACVFACVQRVGMVDCASVGACVQIEMRGVALERLFVSACCAALKETQNFGSTNCTMKWWGRWAALGFITQECTSPPVICLLINWFVRFASEMKQRGTLGSAFRRVITAAAAAATKQSTDVPTWRWPWAIDQAKLWSHQSTQQSSSFPHILWLGPLSAFPKNVIKTRS